MKTALFFAVVFGCYATNTPTVRWAYGGGALYRGYSTYAFVSIGWHKWSDCTVEPATDVITTQSGHGLAPDGYIFFHPAAPGDVLPYPLATKQLMFVHAVNGDQITVRGGDNPTDITDTGSAPSFQCGPQGVAVGEPRLYMEASGLPAGVTVDFREADGQQFFDSAVGKYYSWAAANSQHVRFTAAPDAALGAATVTITFTLAGYPDRTVTIPLDVRPAPTFTPTPPAAGVDVPEALWANTMVTWARDYCDPDNPYARTYSFSNEAQAWYYDGAATYFRIAAYTGDDRWRACGLNIARQYRAWQLNTNHGGDGWRMFPDGLHAACSTCDGRYRYVLRHIVENSPWTKAGGANGGGSIVDDWVRETAYGLRMMTRYQRIFGVTPVNLQKAADSLVAMCYWLFEAEAPTIHQMFFDGLLLRALIEYWELTADPRVPVTVKGALDYAWREWDGRTFPANPFPYGPQCLGSNCLDRTDGEINNPFWAAAFAWYWSITGDDTYGARADEIFRHCPQSPTATVEADDDRWTVAEHGLQEGDAITMYTPITGSLPPAAPYVFHNSTVYVRNPTTNTFQISGTTGGAIINITGDGLALLASPAKWGKSFVHYPRGASGGKQYMQVYWWTFDYLRYRERLGK